MRHPLLVDLDEPADALDQLIGIEVGEAGPLGRNLHPGHVVHWPEHPDVVVDTPVGLHSFKQLLCVMENLKNKNNPRSSFRPLQFHRFF